MNTVQTSSPPMPRAPDVPLSSEKPRIRPGGLVTIAYLKARLDGGDDHLGIFLPLVLDVLSRRTPQSFTSIDIQQDLISSHGVLMPQHTVETLLRRAAKKKYVHREAGRFRTTDTGALPRTNVVGQKKLIEEGQQRLGQALKDHAAKRAFSFDNVESALDAVFRFLETEQVALLLGAPCESPQLAESTLREHSIVAEFIHDAIKGDPALESVMRGMLEGMVLYNAAFLPDLSNVTRRFRSLQVVFDSTLVRQALGYEGPAARTLMRETIAILAESGVRCLVFDKTIDEIHRILTAIEFKLATPNGRASLRSDPMSRHFLTNRYASSDVREMSALLKQEVTAAGFYITSLPRHVKDHTLDENALAARLVDPVTKDEFQPRVRHDVDCVAGVLMLRKGHRSNRIDDVRAVFATASHLVLANTKRWWEEDEHETGICPIIHIRALANLAWLKKPALASDFKMRELVALCTAALRPRPETWQRFLKHLDSLQQSRRLTSDEAAVIVVSAMSDSLLRDAELDVDDSDEISPATLDEIVDRVKALYKSQADREIHALTDKYEEKISDISRELEVSSNRVNSIQEEYSESQRRREIAVDGRARAWARRTTWVVRWPLAVMTTAGAVALILEHGFHRGWINIILSSFIVVFVSLELIGVLHHITDLCRRLERALTQTYRDFLDPKPESTSS